MAGSVIFLPPGFLPMQATQILLNNLLYDIANLSIPTDNVDAEYIGKPKRLPPTALRDYMLWIGPISSIFDFATFIVLLIYYQYLPIYNADYTFISLFQTVWFLESLTTQTFIIFVIRSRRYPFWKSRASNGVFIASFGIVLFGYILPYTELGKFFSFVVPPPSVYLVIAFFVFVYFILADLVKREFYKRHWF
jgi:Mg2+-importing ATPase